MLSLAQGKEVIAFGEWLRDKKRISESTIYYYVLTINKFLSMIEDNYDPEDVDTYNWFLAYRTHKRRSTYVYSVIKAFITFKFQKDPQKREIILDNLIKPKKFRSVKRERRHLDDEKLIEILNNFEDERHRMIAMIQILTGIRAGDAFSIRRNGFVIEEYNNKKVLRLTVVGKGEKQNIVYIFDPIAIKILEDYIEFYDKEVLRIDPVYFKDYIFMTLGKHRKGRVYQDFMVRRRNYNKYFLDLSEAIRKSGVIDKKYFSTHDFRRCFARKAWEKYKDVDKLKRLLNHSDASTTLRYLQQSGLQNIDIFEEMQST